MSSERARDTGAKPFASLTAPVDFRAIEGASRFPELPAAVRSSQYSQSNSASTAGDMQLDHPRP